jgi:hypothetical protein
VCDAQTQVATLTLSGAASPLDVFPLTNPIPPFTQDRQVFQYSLAGIEQIPINAVIQRVDVVITSGVFDGGQIAGAFRGMITDGTRRWQLVNDEFGDPGPLENLEVYGVGHYATGGGSGYVFNPFTGLLWTRNDLLTYQFGFWVQW